MKYEVLVNELLKKSQNQLNDQEIHKYNEEIRQAIENRIIANIFSQLTPDQKIVFEQLITRKANESEILDFMINAMPDLTKTVTDSVREVAKEFTE